METTRTIHTLFRSLNDDRERTHRRWFYVIQYFSDTGDLSHKGHGHRKITLVV